MLNVVVLSVVILSAIVLSLVVLSVIILNVLIEIFEFYKFIQNFNESTGGFEL
jgi:hypothetical protein